MQPIQFTGGFTTDANGNGTDNQLPETSHYSSLSVSFSCPGVGNWGFGPYQTTPALCIATGGTGRMGPIVVRPGERIQTTVQGAQPTQECLLSYTGWVSSVPDGSDLDSVSGGVLSEVSIPSVYAGPFTTDTFIAAGTSPALITIGGDGVNLLQLNWVYIQAFDSSAASSVVFTISDLTLPLTLFQCVAATTTTNPSFQLFMNNLQMRTSRVVGTGSNQMSLSFASKASTTTQSIAIGFQKVAA